MDYPDDFPEHLKPPVDAAIHAAEIAFIDAKQEIAPHRFQYEAERLILRYVETVFFAFATQAVHAGKDGVWNGGRVRQVLPEFLNDIGHRAYFDKHPDSGACHGSERFMEALNKASKNWKGWRAIHEGLKQVAELQARQLQLPTAKVVATPAQSGSASQAKVRTFREPQPELLTGLQSVGKQKAALALGTTTRTIDRWAKTEKLIPIGGGGRTRFRVKDLQKFLDQKKPRQVRQNETKRDA